MLSSAVLVLAVAMVGQADAEKSFDAWTAQVMGGVWKTTDETGAQLEERYEWILNKQFVRYEQKKNGKQSSTAILGIDPATGQFTWWGFTDKREVLKAVVTQESAGVWKFHASFHGPDGEGKYDCSPTVVDKNTMKERLRKETVAGTTKELPELTWRREAK